MANENVSKKRSVRRDGSAIELVAGRGKRGGIRVVYYARVRRGQIWMLTLYAKNVVENFPANVLRQIKEEIDG